MEFMDLKIDKICEIVCSSKRFISPYSDPEPYYIYGSDFGDNCKIDIENLYYEKLRYAVKNAENLVNQAFNDDFYSFYGVDRTAVSTPEQMCSELRFDSFTMNFNDKSVCIYFSNERFMFGHFIEAVWDNNWNLNCSGIC